MPCYSSSGPQEVVHPGASDRASTISHVDVDADGHFSDGFDADVAAAEAAGTAVKKKVKKKKAVRAVVEDIMAYKNSIWTQAAGNL